MTNSDYIKDFLKIFVDTKNYLYNENDLYQIQFNDTYCSEQSEEPLSNQKINPFQQLEQEILSCHQCNLSTTRKNVVIGSGNIQSQVLFIGEAPGFDEDMKGFPFVGKAGQLLDKMLQAISIERNFIYICNILKCRPPSNRNPQQEEIDSCTPFLDRQINMINPKIIVTLGNFASKYILRTDTGISKLRGKTYPWKDKIIVPTYHPSALLQNPELKRGSWYDLKLLRSLIDKMGIRLSN